jgi:O-antigen/teichoic acid export membrane protein
MNLARVLAIRRYLRLAPFETDTAAGRSAERYRRAAVTAVADVGAKALGMAQMFVSVGLTLPYLGTERFGVWATIASLTAMLSLLDLGMGNALIGSIARASADPDASVLVRTASGGMAGLSLFGLSIGVALAMIAAFVPWDVVISLHDPGNLAETRQAAIVFGLLFGLNIAATGIRSVFMGLQRAYVAHGVTASSYAVSMLALWFAAQAKAEVPTLLLLTFGIQILFASGLVVLAIRQGVLARPGLPVIRQETRHLMQVGGLFLLLQIGTMIGWGGDTLMVAHVMGAKSAAEFSVALRLFQLVALPLAILSAPLWGTYAEAKVRGDYEFVRKTLQMNMALVALVGTIGVLLVTVLAQTIITLWTKDAVDVSQSLIQSLALWTLVQGVGASLGIFLNGTGVLKPQIVAVSAFVAIALPVKWLLLTQSGVPAFVLGSIAVYLVTHLSVYLIVYWRFTNRKLVSHPSQPLA